MLRYKKIRIGKKYLEALLFGLTTKRIIIIKGSKGYIMCGYLDLKVAEKFNDVAAKVTGVTNIEDVLKTTVYSCTKQARALGIHKGQPVKEVLKFIA